MNKTFFIGNLTRDPEEFKGQNDNSICKFSIAVGRDYANKDGVKETDFFPVVIFGRLASVCMQYLKKGNKVAVLGSLQNRSYEDKDGIKRTVTEIIAKDIEFLTPKQTEEKDEKKDFVNSIDDNKLPF